MKTFARIWLSLVLGISLASPALAGLTDARSQYEGAFNDAALEFDVPAPLLKAIGFVESKWFQKPVDPDHPLQAEHDKSDQTHQRAYGIMGLRDDNWFGHSLIESARLIGSTPAKLVVDPVLNIRGAAAYLQKLSQTEGLLLNWNLNSEAERLLAWTGVIKKYSGIPGDDADTYASDVFNVLNQGYDQKGVFIAPVGGEIPLSILTPEKFNKGVGDSEYPEADWDPSRNFTLNGTQATHIVIHTTEGSFAGAVSWHKDPQSNASSHFIIRARDGYMKQLVKLKDRAWHARCWNKFAIGIEHEAWMDNPDSFNDTLYRASGNLVKFLAAKLNIPIEYHHIIGHGFKSSIYFPGSGIDPCNDHTDPGMFWDWDGYFAYLGYRAPM